MAGKDRTRIVFVGEYDRSVDGNGRLALPSAFRDHLGTSCYLTHHPDGAISITPKESFDADAQLLLDAVSAGDRPESALRTFAANSSIVSIDKQGRITLDDQARRHAGINPSTNVRLVGNLKNLAIWRPSRYAVMRAEDVVVQPMRVWADEDDE